MSALLMFFYWVVIPIGGFRLARWLFRRMESSVIKGLVVLGASVFFIWFLWVAVGRNMWLDHQVREMCAEDGGVKVYETVVLPQERFDKYDQIRVLAKSYAKPDDEYFYENDTRYLLKGNPEMWRSIFKIIRRNDGKILGEAVSYHRRGGGLFGPWHDSSFSCPENAGDIGLVKQIIIKDK